MHDPIAIDKNWITARSSGSLVGVRWALERRLAVVQADPAAVAAERIASLAYCQN